MSFKEDNNNNNNNNNNNKPARGHEEIRNDERKLKPKIYRVFHVTKLVKNTDVSKKEPVKLNPNDAGAKDSSDQVDAVTSGPSSIPVDRPSVLKKPSRNEGSLGNCKSQDPISLRMTIIADPHKRDIGAPSCNDLPSCSRSPTIQAKSSVKTHPVSHIGCKRYKCWFCPVRFSQKIDLANHIRYLHCRKVELVCKPCRKEFDNSYSLYLHRRVQHRAASNPQSNETCSVQSDKTEALNGSHSSDTATNDLASNETLDIQPCNEKVLDFDKYQCPQCSERFFLRKKYDKHIQVFHNNTNSFKCSVCSKHFNCKYSYKIHVRSHFKSLAADDPFVYAQQCDICGFWFDKLHELYQHNDICKSAHKR